jgi:hypothetical protein
MRDMFTKHEPTIPAVSTPICPQSLHVSPSEMVDYLSDHSSEDSGSDRDDEEDSGSDGDDEEDGPADTSNAVSHHLPAVPPLKRRKLDVPVREMKAKKHAHHCQELEKGFDDIEKLIHSLKTKFVGGREGLQACHACAIQSYLLMVAKRGCLETEASERAAESHGFKAKWGGRNVRSWTCKWLKDRALPEGRRGCHGKVYSLLDDPAIKAELCAFCIRTSGQ